MASHSVASHPLDYVLAQRGWRVAEFARLMMDKGAAMGIPLATNRTLVWKWRHGQEPEPGAQLVLASLLDVNPATVAANPWPRWLPVWEVTGVMAPWTRAGTLDVLADLVRSGRMDVDRRGFLTITGTLMAAVAAGWATSGEAFAAAAGGDRVTDEMVTTLTTRIQTLRTLDAQLGGARLLDQAKGDLAMVETLLKHGTYSQAIEVQLYGLASQISYIAGWMAYDAGLRSAGQQYYVGALRAARSSGDDAQGAFLLAEMGVHLSDHGDNAGRTDLVNTALDSAGSKVAPAVRSYLELHAAESLSRDGRHDRAAAALDRSRGLWPGHGDELPAYLAWYGPAQIESTEGKVMLRSGKVEQATDVLARSIAGAVPRDQAVRSGRLAKARLAGRDLDGALDAAGFGLSLLEGPVHSVRAVDALRDFDAGLNPYAAEPTVKAFRERLVNLPAMAA
ncbi:transcriptional regulator [Kitasatospora sp. NPDC094028]